MTAPTIPTLKTGGALGSDAHWIKVARRHRLNIEVYSFNGHRVFSSEVDDKELKVLTGEQLREAESHLEKANETLGRKYPTSSKVSNNLLRRNYFIVKGVQAVFACCRFETNGKIAKGGTGWGLQMAIDANIPAYAFDMDSQQWKVYRNDARTFVKCPEKKMPKLPAVFAGIGARFSCETGKDAIEKLFKRTYGEFYVWPPASLASAYSFPVSYFSAGAREVSKRAKVTTVIVAEEEVGPTTRNQVDCEKEKKSENSDTPAASSTTVGVPLKS